MLSIDTALLIIVVYLLGAITGIFIERRYGRN